VSGATSYYSGLAAEDSVAAYYCRQGMTIAAQRWRGKGGEIDLIMRNGDGLVFVEVKKSTSFADALMRITERQMARIYQAAGEFLAFEPSGQNTLARFDVALVNVHGQIEVMENAYGL
jgi:putative endonuclease